MEQCEPNHCDVCGQIPSESEPELYECSKCGQHMCVLCYCGVGTICIDCEIARAIIKDPETQE